MRVAVTGGAGYIGRYVIRALDAAGCCTAWLDLRAGEGDGVICDVRNRSALLAALKAFRPHGVIHLAAASSVAESVGDPGKYAENVLMCRNLAEILPGFPVVLASSAAVYGEGADRKPLTEDQPPAPANPYGWSKLASEAALPDAMALRLFNVAGGSGDLGDHLVPRAIQALAEGRALRVNGDGFQVRDFVHVEDVAAAFCASVLAMAVGARGRPLNICTGKGSTITEVVDAIAPELAMVTGPPRAGDVRHLVGDPTGARDHIGWEPERDLVDIAASALMPRKAA